MGKNMNIVEWADYTFNPWGGGSLSGEGEGMEESQPTASIPSGLGEPRKRTSESTWKNPLDWNRQAARTLQRLRVFCGSQSDIFDEEVDPEWRADFWELVRATPFLDWLLVTPWPGNIARMLPPDWGEGWPNVCLMVRVENQAALSRFITLAGVPARYRGLFIEPCQGPVQLKQEWKGWLHWVVMGGESEGGHHPLHPDWVQSLQRQCAELEIPFFFKQWGCWTPNRKFAKLDLSNVAYYWPTSPIPVFLRHLNEADRLSSISTRGNKTFLCFTDKSKTGSTLNGRRYCAHPFDREIATALTPGGRQRLAECEQIVRQGLQTFVEVGAALMEIRNSKLYLATHPTFEAYVQSMMALTRSRAYTLMDSAQVVQDLAGGEGITQLPVNEGQARELRRWKTPEERVKKWKSVLAMADKQPLTARFIRETLNPRPVEEQSAVDPKTLRVQTCLAKLRTHVEGSAAEKDALVLIEKLERLVDTQLALPAPQQEAPRILSLKMTPTGECKVIAADRPRIIYPMR